MSYPAYRYQRLVTMGPSKAARCISGRYLGPLLQTIIPLMPEVCLTGHHPVCAGELLHAAPYFLKVEVTSEPSCLPTGSAC